MVQRDKSRRGGFTLIELLIVVAIIGLLAAMIIPNMLGAIAKAKQKRTMSDEKLVGTAIIAWLTDESSAAAAGAATFTIDQYPAATMARVIAEVVPQYLQVLPAHDGFGHSYDYRFTTDASAERVVAIRSYGRDGLSDGLVYTVGGFEPREFDRDIIWADGYFVSWPGNIDTSTVGSE